MTSSEWKRRGKEAGESLVTRDYKFFFFLENRILFGLPLAKEQVRVGAMYKGSQRKSNSCFMSVQNVPVWIAF